MGLVCGVGINDLVGSNRVIVDGVVKKCKAYVKWSNMLCRCYHPSAIAKEPTYIGCSVCSEWLHLSVFKEWFDQHTSEQQDWQLDKDILVPGNKVYSPDTCILIPHWLNSFVIESRAKRGECPVGVSWSKRNSLYVSYITLYNKRRDLGYFRTADAAHSAWRAAKRNHIQERKDEIDLIDHRLFSILMERYK